LKKLGDDRYLQLKIEKNYNVIRLLFCIENHLYLSIKHNNKIKAKNLLKKEKKDREVKRSANYEVDNDADY
jgi:hypothetical protein